MRDHQDPLDDRRRAGLRNERRAADPRVFGDAPVAPPVPSGRGRRLVGRLLSVLAAGSVVVAVAVNTADRGPEPPPSAELLPPDPAGSPAAPVAAPTFPPARTRTTPEPTASGPATREGPPPRRRATGGPAPAPSATGRAGVSTGTGPTIPHAGAVVQVVNAGTGKPIGVAAGSTQDGAAIVAIGDTAGTAPQWRLLTAGNGCFQLVNIRSGKALDNPDGDAVNGGHMQQWTAFAGNPNQSWCFHPLGAGGYSIRNLSSGFLLDLTDGGTADGTPLQQWSADPAHPNANQTWRLQLVRRS
ncbi:RICIN domain-containing protein [Micromonospora sp. NPDC018662]|uniref:RICIN domain-containing protein n=1 Tax=Micromonospora sp. NPDC018662 TaxID=3364238 RepID=UPI00379D2F19